MVGVDIDERLIERANRNRDVQASLMEPEAQWRAATGDAPRPRNTDYFPLSCPVMLGTVPFLPPEAVAAAGLPATFPANVLFAAADFVHDASDADEHSYDTILWCDCGRPQFRTRIHLGTH